MGFLNQEAAGTGRIMSARFLQAHLLAVTFVCLSLISKNKFTKYDVSSALYELDTGVVLRTKRHIKQCFCTEGLLIHPLLSHSFPTIISSMTTKVFISSSTF